ncbi:hypothetical protein G210_1594 [Candida maltosa Xu316]|uniref:Uncharacterized protein n=1 Tax=Candida maltosa (strain Xu316) TaxID=1245528 RepID=M3INF1_CANMX|nr:hypothetical protein G210_1594 [Candida maltosa Xu316]
MTTMIDHGRKSNVARFYHPVMLMNEIFSKYNQTGKVLLLIPANSSTVGAMNGKFKKSPIYGIDLKNWIIVPKKSPNNPKIPKLSNMNPMNDLFKKINNIPSRKHTSPSILLGRSKNRTVRCGPMINVIPMMNNILPKAKNPESKNVMIPKMKKKIPPAVNPTPNSLYFC